MNDELLFVGKARKVRQCIKNHRDEVYRIDVCIVENPMERGIYETYMINEFQAKYNVNKVFYK
ncbi:excinuclease ABC subunit C [Bacillus wiedmannii]|uniref:Excinuclease ABC subunit C n=1 Tax=Bacillus wiedmannii TaxID=1890302 RepID=A0ABD6TG34_9BACI|nr:excinuclease ABC subunit C [Bacillus sp. BB081]PEO59702.1 excinuclease ABC subunit C [Bacillus wiedmannii]PGC73741.1 excinuclease ABC subunit C [Bacillus wiedmannii]PHG13321.1 excinuclease ABC subunit C [Bacillus wiedmannii]QWH70713.1 excinuclease ABC subunit C [Bacillus wiedmannii]